MLLLCLGDSGDIGEIGDKGYQGPTGRKGFQGPKGISKHRHLNFHLNLKILKRFIRL